MIRALVATAVLVVSLLVAPARVEAVDAVAPIQPASIPIIQIHGYDSQECPGSDASYGWAPFDHVLRNAGWTGPLLPVSFYRCDHNGADITGYGPTTPDVATPDVTPDPPRAGYDQDAPTATLAHDLAWYVYRNFTVRGLPVDLVSLSMGGLIARTAVHRVQMRDPDFPPRLLVARSVTFSTPHHGVGTMAGNAADPGCDHHVQCTEWATDSPLLTELMRDGTDPQGEGGTRWTVIGSSAGCDFLPLPSALGLPHAEQVDFTAPCYSHIGYFWDIRPELEATTVVKDGDDGAPVTNTAAQYSLPFATTVLLRPVAAVPAVAPLPVVTTTPAVTVRFAAGGGTGAATFELRYRTTDTQAWTTVTGLAAGTRAITPDAVTRRLCVSVRARAGDDVSDWSPESCTAIPVDDRALTRTGRWQSLRSGVAYAGTLSGSTRAGDTATTTVTGTGVGLLVRTCPSCGSLQVSLDGRPWRMLATRAPGTRPAVRVLRWASVKTVRVTLRAASSRPVYLDGVAVLP